MPGPGRGLRCRCCCISGCSLRPRIERRIDIAKINSLVADKLPHHIKIVAVKEFVHGKNAPVCMGNVALTARDYQEPVTIVPGSDNEPCSRGLLEEHMAACFSTWVGLAEDLEGVSGT